MFLFVLLGRAMGSKRLFGDGCLVFRDPTKNKHVLGQTPFIIFHHCVFLLKKLRYSAFLSFSLDITSPANKRTHLEQVELIS